MNKNFITSAMRLSEIDKRLNHIQTYAIPLILYPEHKFRCR